MILSQVGRTVCAHPTQSILDVVDIATSVLGRDFPGSSLQYVASFLVHKAVSAGATDDTYIAHPFRKSEGVTHGETVLVAIIIVDFFATGEEALKGGIKVRCHA